jgi:uncharacterized protein YggL (DUF469 family)
MRKRLRKKLRRGEFTEYGFALAGVHLCLNDAARDLLTDSLCYLAERQGLAIGGGVGEHVFDLFVTKAGRGTVTPRQRDVYTSMVGACVMVVAVEASPLVDAWR